MKKKILIVNSFYFPTIVGGAEISTQLLAEGLSKDYEVHVLTMGEQKSDVLTEVINGVTVHRLPSLNIYSPLDRKDKGTLKKLTWHFINMYQPSQAKLLTKVLKEIKPDLIHSQNLMGIGTYLWNISNQLSIPIVHTARDYALIEPVNSGMVNRFIHKVNIKRSLNVKKVVGISNYILKYHQDHQLFQRSESDVIGNVVNAERFERIPRKEGAPLTVGYFGQVSSNKGVMMLVNTIQQLDSSIVKKLVICGIGDQFEEIKELAKTDSRIVLKGKVSQEEVYQQMASVDVTVVPSKWAEPFGRVIIESYQQGTPVLATAVGGIPELIPEKEMLFERENIEELKEKLTAIQKMSRESYDKLVSGSYGNSVKFRDNLVDYKRVYEKVM
jgi:glycosyltransferase involved in cell wall biosynthesis